MVGNSPTARRELFRSINLLGHTVLISLTTLQNLCLSEYNKAADYTAAIVQRNVWIIDTAIPGDFRVENKELEKLRKYRALAIEASRLWKKHTLVVPVVTGTLGIILRNFTVL